MRLSKRAKLFVIIATIMPVVLVALLGFLAMVGPTADQIIIGNSGIFMTIDLTLRFLMFGLITFYLIFLFKTDSVKSNHKALWAIALVMVAPVAMPIFWYLHVRPSDEPGATEPPQPD